eukprot:TRINITY_DN9332_c0_g1_i1.p1 TRINITY_DN9332_c0_g1~~TRINITY_DN9332_c0_g1_i1.p1  ORF type:complete len:185 (+),score=60.87 TRINITY_DN9332_c0_g1_i1:53-607(+)
MASMLVRQLNVALLLVAIWAALIGQLPAEASSLRHLTKSPGGDVIAGKLSALVDASAKEAAETTAKWKEQETAMQHLVDIAEDTKGKMAALTEKDKMKASYEKNMQEIVNNARTLDAALKTLSGDDWDTKWPGLRGKLDALYKDWPPALVLLKVSGGNAVEHPELLAEKVEASLESLRQQRLKK